MQWQISCTWCSILYFNTWLLGWAPNWISAVACWASKSNHPPSLPSALPLLLDPLPYISTTHIHISTPNSTSTSTSSCASTFTRITHSFTCPRILNNRLRAQPWKIKYPVVHRRRPKLSTPSRPPSPQRLHISNFLPLGLGYTLFPRAFLFSNNSLIASSIGWLRCLPSICFPREFMVSQISGNYRFQALCQWAFNRRSAITRRALITLDSQYPCADLPPIHKRRRRRVEKQKRHVLKTADRGNVP